jgi:hypothetical protein
MIRIPKGIIIYRAAPVVEKSPRPYLCEDTMKIGIYFSIITPYLSEVHPLEKKRDLWLARYILVDDLLVHIDKFDKSFPNQSHFDCKIGALPPTPWEDKISVRGAELFLNSKDLRSVRFLDAKRIYYGEPPPPLPPRPPRPPRGQTYQLVRSRKIDDLDQLRYRPRQTMWYA